MPLTSPRVQALLSALCAFRLLPNGFTNRDLRTCLAPLPALPALRAAPLQCERPAQQPE
jgi:hypothetical protein